MSAEAAAAVTDCNASFYAALEAGDIDRMGRVWDAGDAVACVHPGWPMLHGRDRVLRSCSMIMANTAYIQFLLTDVDVQVHGDVAVLTCEEHILASAGSAAPDEVPQAAAVATTNVFRRGADGWRMVVHHGSPVLGAESTGG